MYIEREIEQQLLDWKSSPRRKPLIVKGVRQCGKTEVLKRFGEQHFRKTLLLNFDKDPSLASFFTGSLDTKKLLLSLSAYSGVSIDPADTLLFFDEIQACPRALASLKYFCEDLPELCVVAAGSLIGITLASAAAFPVGKVDVLPMYPCNFKEYLRCVAPQLCALTEDNPTSDIPQALSEQLALRLREFMTLGGLPAVLSCYLDTQDLLRADQELSDLLYAYENDFTKHAPSKEIPKIRAIWKSIPVQFAKENKRFFYGEVRDGARAKDLEVALGWLQHADMVAPVPLAGVPQSPLRAQENRKIFKLYAFDIGILRKLSNLSVGAIINTEDIFSAFKGKFAENFVLQELRSQGFEPICYWKSENGISEVDFLIEHDTKVLPVEVKSGNNTKSKSLKVYREQYCPSQAIRLSMKPYKKDDGLVNIPLYLTGAIPSILQALLSSH